MRWCDMIWYDLWPVLIIIWLIWNIHGTCAVVTHFHAPRSTIIALHGTIPVIVWNFWKSTGTHITRYFTWMICPSLSHSWLPIYESFNLLPKKTLWKGLYGIHLCRCKYPSDAFLNALQDKTIDATWMSEGNRLGAKNMVRAWLLQLHPSEIHMSPKKGTVRKKVILPRSLT